MKLEFTTTACVRPNILKKTYDSLSNVLQDVNLKTEGILYLHIDPVPNDINTEIDREINIAKHYFNEVHYRIGESGGNFSKAASWVLSQPKGEYFFNVEDDWEFTGSICIQDYINKIESDNRENMLQCICREKITNRIFFPPSLFKTSTIQFLLNSYPIPENENPERWLWEIKTVKRLINYNVVGIGGVHCKDIGRAWMNQNNLTKSQDNQRPNSKGVMVMNFIKWNIH